MLHSLSRQPSYQFVLSVWTRMSDGHFGLISAGVAFYAMFSLFPAMAALVAIWGTMADPAVIAQHLEVIEEFLPTEGAAIIREQVMALITAPRVTAGGATLLSLGVALYSARLGVAALIEGLNVMHGADQRSWYAKIARDILLTLALVATMIIALATTIVIPILLGYLPLDSVVPQLIRVVPWIVVFGMVVMSLAILYRYGPYVPSASRTRWVSPGVLFAAFGWGAASLAFSTYLEYFNSYNRIYGSIGAVIILMTWLYLSALAILLGGAIDAEIDSRARMRYSMGKPGRS